MKCSDSCYCPSEIYHDLIQSVVSALEARDPHTAEHSLRVGDMCERFCILWGLPAKITSDIHMAAHVHDIGKIGIPDSVLLKPGRLIPEEYAALREHARIGAQILGSCQSLADIALIVLHHHERWDGAGYPDGLAGEDIPFGSRVVAVCDSIDAMLGKRVYRKALTRQECRDEIERGIGRAYDPAVATFVLDHWDQIVDPIDFHDSDDFDKPHSVAHGRSLRCTVPATLGLDLSA